MSYDRCWSYSGASCSSSASSNRYGTNASRPASRYHSYSRSSGCSSCSSSTSFSSCSASHSYNYRSPQYLVRDDEVFPELVADPPAQEPRQRVVRQMPMPRAPEFQMPAADVVTATDDESKACPICTEHVRDYVFVPCGHRFCNGCIRTYAQGQIDAGRTVACATCKTTVTQAIKVYD